MECGPCQCTSHTEVESQLLAGIRVSNILPMTTGTLQLYSFGIRRHFAEMHFCETLSS